jgi:hypothetical protein
MRFVLTGDAHRTSVRMYQYRAVGSDLNTVGFMLNPTRDAIAAGLQPRTLRVLSYARRFALGTMSLFASSTWTRTPLIPKLSRSKPGGRSPHPSLPSHWELLTSQGVFAQLDYSLDQETIREFPRQPRPPNEP